MHADYYSKAAIKKMIKEHDRQSNDYKSDVDKSRSHLNYALVPDGVPDDYDKDANSVYKRALKRAETILGKDGYNKMPKNTKLMAEWDLSYPVELCDQVEMEVPYKKGKKKGQMHTIIVNKPKDPEHCRQFFETATQMLVERYGVENFLGAYVHMDETTPHLHFNFVPETISRKTGKKTISTASLFTPLEISGQKSKKEGIKNGCQYDMQQKMLDVFGPKAKDWILNGRTLGGYTTDELKARKCEKEDRKAKNKSLKAKEERLNAKEQALKDFEESIIKPMQKGLKSRYTKEYIAKVADSVAKRLRAPEDVKKSLHALPERLNALSERGHEFDDILVETGFDKEAKQEENENE